MSISREEAFNLGFSFAHSLGECYDSRDIGRVLTREDFPPEIQALAEKMNGFCTKDKGTYEAMNLIRGVLRNEDAGQGEKHNPTTCEGGRDDTRNMVA